MSRVDCMKSTFAIGLLLPVLAGEIVFGAVTPDPLVEKVRNAALAIQRASWEQGVLATAFMEEGDDALVVQMARASLIYKSKQGVPAASGGRPVDPLMAARRCGAPRKSPATPRLNRRRRIRWSSRSNPRRAPPMARSITRERHSGQTVSIPARRFSPTRATLTKPSARLKATAGGCGTRGPGFCDTFGTNGKASSSIKNSGAVARAGRRRLTRVIRALPKERQADRARLASYLQDLL